jgi:hypothetical protein
VAATASDYSLFQDCLLRWLSAATIKQWAHHPEYVDQWLNMAENDGTYDAAKAPWFG